MTGSTGSWNRSVDVDGTAELFTTGRTRAVVATGLFEPSQAEKIEETLWVSLRMFEERKNLLNKMAAGESKGALKHSYAQRAGETEIHIERIRAIMLAPAAMNLAAGKE